MSAASTRAARRAANRRAHHRRSISAAQDWREQMARIAGWLTAELRHRPEPERRQLLQQLLNTATTLNTRNGEDRDQHRPGRGAA